MATYELSPRQELLYEDRATVWKPARAKNPTTAVVGDESYTLVDTDVPCYFTFNPSQDDVAEFGRYERDIILTLDLIHFPRDMDIDSDYIVKNQGMNDDGTPEAWVTEASTLCYGNTATAFVLVTKKGRDWVVLLDSVGLPLPLESKTRGWADITVGLPGVGPVPVYRFNGSKYVRVP